jgi:hypothetical protein
MNSTLTDVLAGIDQQPSSTDGTLDQLRSLWGFGNRLGLYDAADFLRGLITRADTRKIDVKAPACAISGPDADLRNVLATLPQLTQRQDSTNDQLADLRVFAIKLGLCDAAGYLRQVLDHQGTQAVRAAPGVMQ